MMGRNMSKSINFEEKKLCRGAAEAQDPGCVV
jgi:hypothetical protein